VSDWALKKMNDEIETLRAENERLALENGKLLNTMIHKNGQLIEKDARIAELEETIASYAIGADQNG